MTLQAVKDRIPDFGRDIRLNLESIFAPDGLPGLTPQQVWGAALATAYSLTSQELVQTLLSEGASHLTDEVRTAARGAATIMAMNNVYYRSTHLMDDEALKKLPARLRMNLIGKPGIAKVDFELMCFAVSALAGCGQCLTAHLHELRKAGITDEGVQSSLKIASVLNAADRALKIAAL